MWHIRWLHSNGTGIWPSCIPFSIPISIHWGAVVLDGRWGSVGVAGRVELTFLARHVDFAFNCFIVRQVLAITQSHSHT